MNKIMWIDKDNMLARIQAGVVGVSLEKKVGNRVSLLANSPNCLFCVAG